MNIRTSAILSIVACSLAVLSCSDRSPTQVPMSDGLYGEGSVAVYTGNPPVLISEVYTANPDYKDEFGSDPGWVEFYNPYDAPADLKGYYLTNDAGSNPQRWAFGNVVVPPKGYILVFMSGRNIPDYFPPSDSIDIMNEAIDMFTWSDSLNTPTAGRSAAYADFSKDPPSFSATLKAVDNSQGTMGRPGLGWTSTFATLRLKGWGSNDVVDMSRANQVVLKGFLGKEIPLEIRFVHPGVEDYQAWPAVIKGTGVADDYYMITLPTPEEGFPDLANINSIRFGNTSSFRGTIEFDFNEIVAYRRASNIHAAFTLANNGSKLFLTDGNGDIRDSVAYPAATLGLSYARKVEDGVNGKWAYSKPPTPLGMNSAETYDDGKLQDPPTTGIPNSGHFNEAFSFTLPQGDNGATIACDLTGALPTVNSQYKSNDQVNITKTTVMRCAQFKDGAHGSDPIMRTYIVGRLPNLPIVSIAVDPFDMFDRTHGLYSLGPNAASATPNYGANFWAETELPVQIEFFEGGMRPGWTHRAGLRIFGGWSRSNDKKSVVISFRDIYGQGRLNYRLLPDLPTQTRYKHFLLRNNGNNFGHDYIRDMLMTSLTDKLPTDGAGAEGLGIDYQRGRPVVVFYNGEYYGIHDIRERANGDYFETKYGDGYSQEYIDLIKATDEVSEGSIADYQNIVNWLEGLNGLSDENLRQLNERIDVDNFTNVYTSEIFYNNRDWPGNNMKRWRRHSPASRWKWLMYDTDQGFRDPAWIDPRPPMIEFATAANQPDDNSFNSPRVTFLIRKLLENEGYKNSFINRFSLMVATYFTFDRVNARIDALMAPIQDEITYDQQRWWPNDPRKVSYMDEELVSIRNFVNGRRTTMVREFKDYFKLSDPVDLTLEIEGGGYVNVNGLRMMGNSVTFNAYPSVPVTLRAVGTPFYGWDDGVAEAERIVTVSQAMTLTARFANSVGVLERDRIIPDEYR